MVALLEEDEDAGPSKEDDEETETGESGMSEWYSRMV